MMVKKEREIHRKIKNVLAELEQENTRISLHVKTIAKKTGISVRRALMHLEILEEDEKGVFCDDRRRTFSSSKHVVSMLGKERLEKVFARTRIPETAVETLEAEREGE